MYLFEDLVKLLS